MRAPKMLRNVADLCRVPRVQSALIGGTAAVALVVGAPPFIHWSNARDAADRRAETAQNAAWNQHGQDVQKRLCADFFELGHAPQELPWARGSATTTFTCSQGAKRVTLTVPGDTRNWIDGPVTVKNG